jgi:translation initiation factor IF-2
MFLKCIATEVDKRSGVTNPKVFEFAKEIGIETLVLMDKIREWHLPVKNHMAELSPDLIETIRSRLNSPKEDAEAKKIAIKKKTPAKKAQPPPTSFSNKEPATVSTASGAVPKVLRRKAAAIESPVEFAEDKDIESPVEGPIVDHDVVESVPVSAPVSVRAPVVSAPSKIELQTVAKETQKEIQKETHTEKQVLQHAAPQIEKPQAEKPKVKEDVAIEAKKVFVSDPAVVTTAAAPAVETIKSPAAPVAPVNRSSNNPMNKTSETSHHISVPPPHARKKEVVVGQSGHASPQKPAELGRRNIVGRMDLSRVSPPPGSMQRSQGGNFNSGGGFQGGQGFQANRGPGTGGGYGGGAGRGPGGMGGGASAPSSAPGAPRTFNRNIRTGFVATPIVEEEEPNRRSKFDDRNKKFKQAVDPNIGIGAAADVDQAQIEFNSAEFRKREMVFQPKKKKSSLGRDSLKTAITTPKVAKRILKVTGTMKLSDAGQEMGLKATQLIKVLMQNGVVANINTDLDFDTLALIVPEFGWEAQNVFKTADQVLEDTAFGDLDIAPVTRPPVVAVMGHVDHGKTSLLDAIRKTDVAAGEAGGITQHIGAYQVHLDEGQLVTFLDTPGHEAFTAMRARGANVTDIAVIVVAADDGVMPQTIEAINHAKAAEVPIVVAVNKMDKPGANPDRIKQQLTEYQIVPEEWGGNTIFVGVSALKRTGIKELLEQILLIAEVQELRANPKRSGTGAVIEARLEKGRGPVATILIQDGTVKVGDLIVAGTSFGRVRSLMNDKGERVESAGPSVPVEILGLNETAAAGDRFDIVKDDKTLERAVELRRAVKAKAEQSSSKMSIEDLFSKVKTGAAKNLNMILKSDVAGSAEAIIGMIQKAGTDEVKPKIVHSGVGGISESDILLAKTSGSIVIGFNTRPDTNAQALAKRTGVEVRTYSIVYEMMDDLKRLMSGLLEPEIVEEVHGRAEVRNTFTVPKIGMIAGCAVVSGKIARSHMVRLIRNGVIVYQGKIGSLKRFKDDTREVATGFECGIGIENYNDLKVADVIEAYTRIEKTRSLDAESNVNS